MQLLTWHGTLLCLRDSPVPVHLALPLADPAPAALEIDMDAPHLMLGAVTVRPAPHGHGSITLSRDARFLCAEPNDPVPKFDRTAASLWETFLPLTAQQVADLQHLLRNSWIVSQSRTVIRRSTISLEDGFTLRIGGLACLDLGECLPLSEPGAASPPERLRIRAGSETLELVCAGPRGSALLKPSAWPVRARRMAETMAVAAYRHLRGREPEQHEFERDVRFLLEGKGAESLEDLFERLGRAPGLAGSTLPGSALGAVQTAGAPCPVVSLGTTCIVACTLRSMGLEQAPMPFDWLGSTPAMVRHCIETDFAMLLDRSQYRSLTGKPGFRQPQDGCAHEFYAREFGIERVFNHNDPTRPADYRYTETCVDRFRDLLAGEGRKIFVQVREHTEAARADFLATAALIDARTQGALFIQFAVAAPDRTRAMPLMTAIARQGPHILYHLYPISQMAGEWFEGQTDRDFLAWTIATHLRHPPSLRAQVAADRGALQKAADIFGRERPSPEQAHAPGGLTLIGYANYCLHAFLAMSGMARRIGFGLYDARAQGQHLTLETGLVEISGGQARLLFDPGQNDFWGIMHRSLGLVYLLDLLLSGEPVPDRRFLTEFGDRGYRTDSVQFCSTFADAMLIPDSDFFITGGYHDLRREMASRREAWHERRPVAFWRGATTGGRRHAPPPDGEEDDFTWLPRLDLCHRARRSARAAQYDVGIVDIVQVEEPNLVARIEASGVMGPRLPRSAFLGNKAVLVIDGNSNAWSALFCALLSGACVLKVESRLGFRQWYSGDLKPWIHFVPVREDLGDLDDIVEWVLSHDADACAIGTAGRAFAEAMTFEVAMEDAAGRLRRWLT